MTPCPQKALFVCGGTGGHVYPALAVAQSLAAASPKTEIVFAGNRGGFEETVVPSYGYRFESVRIRGLSRGRFWINLSLLYLLPAAVVRALRMLKHEKPDLVFGTGGYVCGPVLWAARFLRLPIYLQEQNAFPGLVTRWFAACAKQVFLAFDETRAHLNSRAACRVTGNPIRRVPEELDNIREKYCIDKAMRLLLVFGGSQGSAPINKILLTQLKRILENGNIFVFWQTGPRHYRIMTRNLQRVSRLVCFPYIDNLYAFYHAADLVLCRAGAMTLTELARFAKPAVLIPLPGAAGDHQRRNAVMAEKAGAAVCLEQQRAEDQLAATLLDLFADSGRRDAMGRAMAGLFHEHAAETIAARLCGETPE